VQVQESLKVLLVKAGGRDFAIDVGLIRAIERPAHRVRLPGAPAYVRGVVEVRGLAVAVVDLAMRLGLSDAPKEQAAHAAAAVVVVDSSEPVGFAVDAVGDVVALAPSSLVDLGPRGAAAGLRALTPDGSVLLEVEPLVDGRSLEPALSVLEPDVVEEQAEEKREEEASA
jgi:purine-binding chemotaxis protein CheW